MQALYSSIELFVGAGGLAQGLARGGFHPRMVAEWNKDACQTLRENQARGFATVQHWPVVQEDVRNVSFESFEGIDLVSGGPPCQPFSIGGKHAGLGDTRDMFPQAVRAVRETRPRAFIFENVKGLTRPAFFNYLQYIRFQLQYPEIVQRTDEAWTTHLSRLEQHHSSGDRSGLTYRVCTEVLQAADFGVPQKRERVFFVGFREDVGAQWRFPQPTHSREQLLDAQYRTGEYWQRHKLEPPSSPPAKKASKARLHKGPELFNLETRAWRTVRDALQGLPDPCQERSTQWENHLYVPGARSYPGHTGSVLDAPSKTLKAGDHGVPGGENMLLRLDGTVRYFTVRESARLQTFDDAYVFTGAWGEAMRQLGNAVPVALAEVVASSVAQSLRKLDAGRAGRST